MEQLQSKGDKVIRVILGVTIAIVIITFAITVVIIPYIFGVYEAQLQTGKYALGIG